MKRKYDEFEKENTNNNTSNITPVSIENPISDNQSVLGSKKIFRNIDKEEVRTYCRIRPLDSDPGIYKISESDHRILTISEDGRSRNCSFSQVFGPTVDQQTIFTATCLPLINDLIEHRKSGLIFAYGITNSGKTYTITGKQDIPGILPLALTSIMKATENKLIQSELFVNFIEIYNEVVYDLLANTKDKGKKKVDLKENRNKTFYVKNVTDRKINSFHDLNECLNMGLMKKTHAVTQLNQESSRSHTIFKIIVRFQNTTFFNETEYEEASLSIVDLAGSEKVSRSETTGKEFKETCNINLSLSTLSQCLDNMRYNSKNTKMKIIPYRESELTKVFMEYFQGGQNIIMIANINPSKEDLNETLNVINYACFAKEIKPSKCRIITKPMIASNTLKKAKN